MIKYIETKGNDYNIGYQIGEYFRNYLQKRIIDFDAKVEKVFDKIKRLEGKIKTNFPKLLQEIYGRADGAQISRDSLLLMFFPEIYNRIDGCTTVILKKSDRVLFAHNEDNSNFTEENVALIKYNYGDRFVVSYTMAERLGGSAISFNSDGLVFSSNFVNSDSLNLDNLSRYIVVRDVINSQSIDEAIEKLRKNDVASAFSLNILDTKTNRVINIEKDVHEVYITEIQEKYARSNHFHSHDNYNIAVELPFKSSLFRYNKTNELINKLDINDCTLNDLINILLFKTDDYYQCVYKQYGKFKGLSVTDATLAIDSSEDFLTIYDYVGNSIIKVDLNGNLLEQKINN